MMNLRVDERFAYVEVEVFGRYQPERLSEIIDAMRGLAERHGHFSQLEIHHGKPDNLMSSLHALSKSGRHATDYEFLRGMRKFALVSDNPPILYRIVSTFTSQSRLAMKIFPMHERDMARQWVEEGASN